jgi:hypothetical protein
MKKVRQTQLRELVTSSSQRLRTMFISQNISRILPNPLALPMSTLMGIPNSQAIKVEGDLVGGILMRDMSILSGIMRKLLPNLICISHLNLTTGLTISLSSTVLLRGITPIMVAGDLMMIIINLVGSGPGFVSMEVLLEIMKVKELIVEILDIHERETPLLH